ncbi:hypothetical protein LWI28_008866 [Acer negundo]|uniref:Cotton fiber protein n=1 Tax=Acer negundo TaxID=4023 RepID=A0AAD5JK56_ACENE|nr:hypothetical protein LWI28_008866 [Acer negundo]KAK4856700.1 hypothetical protein QYF36_020220 [Acer negundo]
MYRSSLAKKLKPAKRAWKGLTKKLQSKLHSLNIPKTIKTTTHRLLAFCSRHLFMPLKKRFLTKPASRHQYPYMYQYQNHQNQLLQKNFAAIYIDNLYQYGHPSSSAHAKQYFHAETSRSTNEAVEEKSSSSSSVPKKSVYSIEDAWEAVVARSPQLRGVDERADEFIYKFREDMKIQRERSLLEYQEMLSRGS